MTKRLSTLLALTALSLSVLPAQASPRTSRTETLNYVGPGQVQVATAGIWYSGTCAQGPEGQSCSSSAAYTTTNGERYVSVKIVDQSGTPVGGIITQRSGMRRDFCGKSGRVKITPRMPVNIWLQANPCGMPPGSAPTTGTVTTTFFSK